MTGRSRTATGELRKASQRHGRPAIMALRRIAMVWQEGQPVRWKDREGIYRRDTGAGLHAEIVLDGRIYRVRVEELT